MRVKWDRKSNTSTLYCLFMKKKGTKNKSKNTMSARCHYQKKKDKSKVQTPNQDKSTEIS